MKSRLKMVWLLWLLALAPGCWAQYPLPPFAAPTGPTPGATLRNAVAAMQNQASIVRRTASDWGRRAGSATYGAAQFQHDYTTMLFQFQTLRTHLNAAAVVVQQSGQARAINAVAELDAGLNLIAELPAFLAGQFNAGTLDRQTITRTCRAMEDAMREWERELKKNSSRIGLVW